MTDLDMRWTTTSAGGGCGKDNMGIWYWCKSKKIKFENLIHVGRSYLDVPASLSVSRLRPGLSFAVTGCETEKWVYLCLSLSFPLYLRLSLSLSFTCPPRCHWSMWGGWARFETSHSRETSPPWKKRYIEFDFQKPSQYFSGITVGIWFWESILDWTYIYIG